METLGGLITYVARRAESFIKETFFIALRVLRRASVFAKHDNFAFDWTLRCQFGRCEKKRFRINVGNSLSCGDPLHETL